MRSRRGSTPRIPSAASCRRPASCWRCNFRARACASIPAWRQGGEVTPYYDPMIAKMIAHAPTREAGARPAGRRARRHRRRRPAHQSRLPRRALPRAGVPRRRIRHRLHRPQSRQRSAPRRRASTAPPPRSARRSCWRARAPASPQPSSASRTQPASPWDATDGFQLSGARRLTLPILVDGESVVGAGRATAPSGAVGHCGWRRARPRCGGGRGGRCGLCAAPRPPDRGALRRSRRSTSSDHGDGGGLVQRADARQGAGAAGGAGRRA